MKYLDITPDYYVEKKSNIDLFNSMCMHYGNDYTFVVRSHDQELPKIDGKYVLIVTSSEQHNHVPPEINDKNCISIGMHYPPLNHPDPYQATGMNKLYENKIAHIRLGCHKDFVPKIQEEKEYTVSFVGQYDPYRRADFYKFCQELDQVYTSCYFHFYEGWNKGLGAEKYAEILGKTHIALVPYGSASKTTFRFYEAMVSGCTIVSQEQYDIVRPDSYLKINNWNVDEFIELTNTIRNKK